MWCQTCAGKCYKENFYNKVKGKNGEVLGEYINSTTKVLVKCHKKHTWKVKPSSIMNNRWCKKCAKKCPEEAKKEFYEKVKTKNGEVIGEYIDSNTSVLLKCEHGHTWEAIPYNIRSNRWCIFCNESKGEMTISLFLKNKGINYKKEQFKIIDETVLRFDFMININNKNIIIEYDGNQHFEFVSYFCKTKEDFERRKYLDFIKTKWAIENNFYLLRIDYKSIKNINELLEEYFKFIENNEPFYLVSNEKMYSELNTKLSEYVTIFDLK